MQLYFKQGIGTPVINYRANLKTKILSSSSSPSNLGEDLSSKLVLRDRLIVRYFYSFIAAKA